MTPQEAKEILQLYRPAIDDPSDPDVAAALSLAKQDGDLAHWFESHCAFQGAMRARFRQISVPDGLREQILSERRAHTMPVSGRRLALAGAMLVLAFALGMVLYQFVPARENKGLAGFRQRMAQAVLRQYPHMDLETADQNEIRRFLVEKGQGNYVLPGGLEKTTTTGCALLRWQNKPVAMVCFRTGRAAGSKDPDLFLFVVATSEVPGAPAAGAPRCSQNHRLATATWTAGEKTYLLEAIGEEGILRTYLD